MHKSLIKNFYDSARFQVGSEKTWSTTNLDVAERFAELIIEECGKVIEAHFEPVYDGKLIKQHFGIES